MINLVGDLFQIIHSKLPGARIAFLLIIDGNYIKNKVLGAIEGDKLK